LETIVVLSTLQSSHISRRGDRESKASLLSLIKYQLLQKTIRFLPGRRLLAFSDTHLMIYSFVIIEGVEATAPAIHPAPTQPLWSIPLAGTHTESGSLSQGLSNGRGTHFILTTMDRILNVIVPNSEVQPPRLIEMMEYHRQERSTSVVGFEKAFIQHRDDSISRLSFSWDDREDGSVNPWLGGSCAHVMSKDYPTTHHGAYPPRFDEGTGRIVQNLNDGLWVIDTALLYLIGDNS
jgi:hypothetical protein